MRAGRVAAAVGPAYATTLLNQQPGISGGFHSPFEISAGNSPLPATWLKT